MTMFRTLAAAVALCTLLIAPKTLPAQDLGGLRTIEAAQQALPRAPRLPRSAFMENRTLVTAELSPAGDAVAYLREQKDSRALWLLPTGGGNARLLVGSTQAEQVMWSRDGHWLFLRASRVLTIVGRDGRNGVRVPLGGSERRRVIKLDPSQLAAVLLGERVLPPARANAGGWCAWTRMASAPCCARTRTGSTTSPWMRRAALSRWLVSKEITMRCTVCARTEPCAKCCACSRCSGWTCWRRAPTAAC